MAKNNPKTATSGRKTTEKNTSFRENLAALRNIPHFFKLVWDTSPYMITANIILRLCKAGIPLATLYVGKLIIDQIIELIPLKGEGDLTRLWGLLALEFGLALLSDVISRGIILIDSLLGDLFSNESSIRLMRHAAQLDLSQFEDAEFYDKLERARRQITGRVMLLSQMLTQLQDLVTIFILGIGLVLFNPWLIVILVIAIIPSFVSENYFNRSSYSLVRSWTPERRELDYLRYIGASDQTAKEVKIFGLSDFLTGRFKYLSDKYYKANKELAVKRSIWGILFSSLGNAGYYIAYIFIAWQTVRGELGVGDLTFLVGSFGRLQTLLQGILSRFSSIAQNALYLQDLFDFFNMQSHITSPSKPVSLPDKIVRGFTFEDVGFKYPNSEIWAVRHISFHLNAKEKLALVGENGAGKTTLVKLLSRLYDPDEGRILLDGQDIREYDLLEYRKFVGVIFQDFVRFQMNASVNIAVGNIDEKDAREKIIKSAKRSLADGVIEKLPQQYNQMLGKRFESGVELSGGEWQKIALGRAYMRDAHLLILDEPTAALDARAEYKVFERFSELTQGKTAVLISHRFSTVRMADRIMVLKKGEMIELGAHETLLAKGGLYAELFNLQAEGYK